MKSIRALLAKTALVAALAAFALVLASESLAVPITVPTALNPGDQYRLAFVTSGVGFATSSSIADYDAFVTAEAMGVTELVALGTTWQILGSTAGLNARDHTGTDPSVAGIPIFLLNDTMLADDYADLWDGSIDVTLQINQFGNSAPDSEVWTGTASNGLVTGNPLGDASNRATKGIVQVTDSRWVSSGNGVADSELKPYYAISDVLVVPEPSTAVLVTGGLVALSARGRRRKA